MMVIAIVKIKIFIQTLLATTNRTALLMILMSGKETNANTVKKLRYKSGNNKIECANINALITLFAGIPGTSLNKLRYRRYYEKLVTKTSLIQPQNIPPTAAAG